MKKVIAVVMFLFMGTTMFSQGIDLGIKAGANFSTLSDVVGVSNKTGFHAGLFGAVKFNSKIALQAELLYSQQGAKWDFGEFDLNYMNVPVFIKYYLIQGLSVQIGPQFGFIIDDKVTNAEINKSDISGILGLGYDFPLGIRIDARYNLGFSDVQKGDNVEGKNSVFSLALGYSFL